MSSDWGSKIAKIRPDIDAASGTAVDATQKLDHPKAMSNDTEYRHELKLRDDQLRREIELREQSFRSEQGVRDKALDERLGRMEDSVSDATKEIKDFKLWMAGIGVAVVLAIMGANYTLIGSAQGIFDGGKSSLQSQQRIEKLIEESQLQAKQNRELLESIQASQIATPKAQK
ncbi:MULTISPECIES: hypothetical protein [Pseudomonas]|uniref:hypothetical protein n=1 Tax=Pseudomonas TaxID=286 RepID=UPI000CFB41E6|nr:MULTISPECIES: hypothetical protein [Pseudomonas]PQZ83966.1 hypothetical protein CQ048_25390 [Pseudomonas trivialis]PRB20025.1 hypothetical protein CQ041_25455 [Pseudomonas sp. MYb60]